jgi:hypothetical protein
MLLGFTTPYEIVRLPVWPFLIYMADHRTLCAMPNPQAPSAVKPVGDDT